MIPLTDAQIDELSRSSSSSSQGRQKIPTNRPLTDAEIDSFSSGNYGDVPQESGGFVSSLTSPFRTFGKGLSGAGEIARGSLTRKQAEDATKKSSELIAQAKALPLGNPQRKILLEQAQRVASTSVGEAGKQLETLERAPTSRQMLGATAQVGLTLGVPGTGGVASRLGGGLLARSAESGIVGAAFQAASNLEKGKNITEGLGTATLIGGAVPVVGSALSGAKRLFGKGIQRAGEKIQSTVIKPSAKDIADGFKIETVNKYGLGGSLSQTLQKTQSKMDELASELKNKITRSDAAIDLNDVYKRTINSLGGQKSRQFGNIGSIKRVSQNLASEIEEVSENGLVDLSEAQLVKQGAGTKGSWVFGSADPDATAVERVYTAFYRELKKEIENKAPAGVRGINQQLSELIPVMNAVIRRIPVAERNNVLSLNEVIALGFSAINPSSLALFSANRLSRSGRFGALLQRSGQAISKSREPRTLVGQRIFGKPTSNP